MSNVVVGHIARRGAELHAVYQASKPDGNHEFQMPAWGVFCIAVTFIAFVIGLSSISYTFGDMIPALATVESSTAMVFEAVSSHDSDAALDGDKKPRSGGDSELVLVKQAPITSSFRKTILHLRAQAGYLSRFRGLAAFIAYNISLSIFSQWFLILPYGIGYILASVILARVRMTWTHIVISGPSTKYWFQRHSSLKTFTKIAGPTAFVALSEQLSVALPSYLYYAFGLHRVQTARDLSDMGASGRQLLIVKTLALFGLALFTSVALVVPAQAALTRVHASLLAEDEDTIIPFDRTFGGKVVPTAEGGSGVVSMLDAWRTFDWNSRVRLLKVYVKAIAMQVVLTLLFVVALVTELHLILGDDFKKILQIGSGEPARAEPGGF